MRPGRRRNAAPPPSDELARPPTPRRLPALSTAGMVTLIAVSIAVIALAVVALVLGRDAVIALAVVCVVVFLAATWLLNS